MKTKLVKLTYTLSANKKDTNLTEEHYKVTKETEKMFFLENEDGKTTKQNKSVLDDIKVELETSSIVRLRLWCNEKDLKKSRKLLTTQLKDIVMTWSKSTKSMLDQLK